MEETLIFITGAPGTGKSTTARELEVSLEAFIGHSLYQVRRDLGHKRYMPKRKEEVFEELMRRVSSSLDQEESVILDTAVARANGRQRIYDLAAEYEVGVLVLECTCSPKEAKRRIRNRPKNDGFYCESRKPVVYTKFMERVSTEPITQDILKPENAHLSYVTFDTENYSLSEQKVLHSARGLVNRIASILLPQTEYRARQDESNTPQLAVTKFRNFANSPYCDRDTSERGVRVIS